jgi:hypothetical protein
VRAAVSANPNTPHDVLRQMVTDRSKLVRFWLTAQMAGGDVPIVKPGTFAAVRSFQPVQPPHHEGVRL